MEALYKILKALYESLGAPYPKASLVAAFLIFGALGSGAWWLLGQQVAKDASSRPSVSTPTIIQHANDSNCSNIATGGDATINCGSSAENKNAQPQASTPKH